MPENNIRVWEVMQNGEAVELYLSDRSSLDAVTRQLPGGFYSTFRTYDGGKRALGLRAHLQRLYQPAAQKNISPSVSVDVLRYQLASVLGNYLNEARVRVAITYKGKILLNIQPLKKPPAKVYLHGVKAITTNVQRQNPRLKSTAFISASETARKKIAQSEIFEALLVRNDFILEGMTSNFFYVENGGLGTARRDILLGVTRRTVLRVARGSGLDIVYRPLKREQVPALNEAFLTSSSRGIVPIIQIDDIVVGKGSPGPITKELMNGYQAYVMRHAELIYPY